MGSDPDAARAAARRRAVQHQETDWVVLQDASLCRSCNEVVDPLRPCSCNPVRPFRLDGQRAIVQNLGSLNCRSGELWCYQVMLLNPPNDGGPNQIVMIYPHQVAQNLSRQWRQEIAQNGLGRRSNSTVASYHSDRSNRSGGSDGPH